MLTLTTILTANSQYDALSISGRVIAVRQVHGTYMRDITGADFLPVLGTCTVPNVGERFVYNPASTPTVTTSRVTYTEAKAAEVSADLRTPLVTVV